MVFRDAISSPLLHQHGLCHTLPFRLQGFQWAQSPDRLTELNSFHLHVLLSPFLCRSTVRNIFFFIMILLSLKKKHSFYNRKWFILSVLAEVLFPSLSTLLLYHAAVPFGCWAKVLPIYLFSFSRMQCTGFGSNSDFKSKKERSLNKIGVESGLGRVQFLFTAWSLSNERQMKSAGFSKS